MKIIFILIITTLCISLEAKVAIYAGNISGTRQSCYLKTDLSTHEEDIIFYHQQRRSSQNNEVLENPQSYGEAKISLILGRGKSSFKNLKGRSNFQPANPLNAIDREFLGRVGAVYINHYLKVKNISFYKGQPKEYNLKLNLNGLNPKSYRIDSALSKQSYTCKNLRLLDK